MSRQVSLKSKLIEYCLNIIKHPATHLIWFFILLPLMSPRGYIGRFISTAMFDTFIPIAMLYIGLNPKTKMYDKELAKLFYPKVNHEKREKFWTIFGRLFFISCGILCIWVMTSSFLKDVGLLLTKPSIMTSPFYIKSEVKYESGSFHLSHVTLKDKNDQYHFLLGFRPHKGKVYEFIALPNSKNIIHARTYNGTDLPSTKANFRTGNYSITVPDHKNWELKKTKRLELYISQMNLIKIMATDISSKHNFQQICNKIYNRVKNTPKLSNLTELTKTTVNGYEAFYADYDYKKGFLKKSKSRMYLINTGDRYYQLFYTTPKHMFSFEKERLERIIHSFSPI